jgi:hypothetical protein
MKLRMHDGSEQAIVSDASWQAHEREIEGSDFLTSPLAVWLMYVT